MSEPLLGVILATSSSRGSHIVFRWPNNPKLFKRYSKVKYYTDSRPTQSSTSRLDDDLDPVRAKAKWDRHDEDDDDNQADPHSDTGGQSDTPSSSDDEDSDASGLEDADEARSVRDRAETIVSHGRSKGGAPSTNRSKSKPRRPILGMEDGNQSVRSADRKEDDKADSDAGTSKELSPEEKARREEKAARAYKNYLGYDVEILASILNPRPELAHQKFELIVDDLAFLGHPVSAGKGGTWGEPEDHDQEEVDDAQERIEQGQQQRGRSGLRKEIRPYDLPDAEEASTDTALAAKKESKQMVSSRSFSQSRPDPSITTDTSGSRTHAPLSQFHLVLVLDRPDPSAATAALDLSSWLQLFYDNIVFKMTAALFAEQSKSDYVGRETEKLLSLRERCMDDGQAYAAYAAQCLGISSLARCIRDLHKSISTSSDAFLTINDRIEVHLQLPPILQDPSSLGKMADIETELDPNDPIFLSGGGFAGLGKEGADEDGGGGTYDRLLDLAPNQLSFEEWCRTTGPYLLPWKTLLLLHDETNDEAGGDSTPAQGAQEAHGFEQLARNFTSLFRPNLYHSLNFSEVADMLGWNLYEDVYPMIRHLIYYRQARVIDIPRPGHVYAISPLFDFARLGPLSRLWAQAFPDVAPLPVFLSQLSSSGRALSALFPARSQRELALDVLIWLLRREVVVKMHIRLRLIATEGVKRMTAERRLERHERHKARKERRREKAAKAEARKMRRSQAEERAKREAKEEENVGLGLGEQRGRSRDRDRSRSADTRGQERLEGHCEVCAEDGGEEEVATSGLSVSRPPLLAHPDSVAEAAAAAAAIAGSGNHHHHRHHHGHHHHHHHHHHHKKQASGTDSSSAAEKPSSTEKTPIPIATHPRQPFDELKFERRPVLRSRSPSTTATAPPPHGLSVSFSTLTSDHSELTRRARADTTTSSSSKALSMTPSKSQQSRPTTPRNIPSHVRDRSVGGASNISSSAEGGGGGSLPRRARRAASNASVRKGLRSRSPSRARMRVRGFGVGAEVEIDEEKSAEESDEGEETVEPKKEIPEPVVVKEPSRRRISTASERPDLPPPSDSDSDRHSDSCSCSACSSSSSDESSDFSLSSDSSPSSHRSSSVSSHDRPRITPDMNEEDFVASLIVEPSRASRRENEYIATMVADKDPSTVKNFFRLLPYLNGKHTIDEMEYRMKMRRRDIRRLLSVFREYIVTFMHP